MEVLLGATQRGCGLFRSADCPLMPQFEIRIDKICSLRTVRLQLGLQPQTCTLQ